MEKYNRLTQVATLVVLGLMGLSCNRMEVMDPEEMKERLI